MVTKAIVEDATNKYEIKVRIPIYDRASIASRKVTTEDLPVATVCTLPNSGLNLQKGDIVFVSFEDGDIGRPVIIGCLFKEKMNNTGASIFANSIEIDGGAKMPKQTSIGEVTAEELSWLRGVSDSIQGQINDLYENISVIEDISLYKHAVQLTIDRDAPGMDGDRDFVISFNCLSSSSQSIDSVQSLAGCLTKEFYSSDMYQASYFVSSANVLIYSNKIYLSLMLNYGGVEGIVQCWNSYFELDQTHPEYYTFSDTVTKVG